MTHFFTKLTPVFLALLLLTGSYSAFSQATITSGCVIGTITFTQGADINGRPSYSVADTGPTDGFDLGGAVFNMSLSLYYDAADGWVLFEGTQYVITNPSTALSVPTSGWVDGGAGCATPGTIVFGASFPVEWLNVSAKQVQTAVAVSWSTASELNSSHFTLQRATDGETFSDLATLPSHGTSTVTNSYELTDNSPLAGRNLYRVQETGVDGAVSHSATVEVSFAPMVSVGTNANSLVIRGAAAGDRFFLYDMAGRLVRDLSLTSANQTVSVSESGIYCWRLQGSNAPLTGKVLLQF